jgi:hypothetical protein
VGAPRVNLPLGRFAPRVNLLLGRFAVAAALAGCAVETVHQRAYPRLQEGLEPITRVAVVPLAASGDLAQAARRAEIDASVVGTPAPEAGTAPDDATALVGRYLSEALAKRGLDVIPPEDVARALAEVGSTGRVPREVARITAERFGTQGVVTGSVSRYRERSGGAQESGAASVWFEVALHTAPEGEKLWAGVFNETQRPALDNVLVASRYPGGGSRWLSAEELARWGAEQVAASMPLGTTAAPASRP